jgi:hypothetical protein
MVGMVARWGNYVLLAGMAVLTYAFYVLAR